MAGITITDIIFPKSRKEWREWLSAHFETAGEVWVAIPKKNKPLDYNDLIEEALCFNWIDSTLKTLDDSHTAQRMSPRRTQGNFSQLNMERIRLILRQDLVHPKFIKILQTAADAPFIYPDDILIAIQQNPEAWQHFLHFPEPYKRIRIASIESARTDQALFEKRLTSFIDSCAQNKLVAAGTGMQKYYSSGL
jgi:uncharacterized protein YdeI (YjbR/CyaY-like superfamily)